MTSRTRPRKISEGAGAGKSHNHPCLLCTKTSLIISSADQSVKKSSCHCILVFHRAPWGSAASSGPSGCTTSPTCERSQKNWTLPRAPRAIWAPSTARRPAHPTSKPSTPCGRSHAGTASTGASWVCRSKPRAWSSQPWRRPGGLAKKVFRCRGAGALSRGIRRQPQSRLQLL